MALAGIFCWIAAIKETQKKGIRFLFIGVSILVIIVNVSLITATVLLGYHYLADVIASVILFLMAWFFLYPMVKKEKG
jgi:membrane-associated phospholipid phosphatase